MSVHGIRPSSVPGYLSLLSKGLTGLFFVALLYACQDAPPTTPDTPRPQFDISDGSTGGNPDFFFGSPLSETPQPGDENFDDGAANEVLVPFVRVCETVDVDDPDTPDNIEDHTGCLTDVTAAVTGSDTGLAMTFDADTELYKVNWKTDELVEDVEYRIEVWGVGFPVDDRDELLNTTFADDHPILPGQPRWLFGWRDIDNSPSTASCDGTEEFCLVNYGQTLPVKVRIEDFVFCPSTRNCAVQFVAEGVDANLEATLEQDDVASSVQLFIPGQDGTDFALAFEPCSADEEADVDAAIDLPTFGPCLETVTPPDPIELTEPATLSYCLEVDEAALEAELAVPETQLDLLKVHHFSTGGDPTGPITQVEAWPEVAPACGEPTSGGLASAGAPEGLLGRALALGERAVSLFRPQRLVALDQGGGGEGFDLNSFFKLALPAKFEYENPDDDFQTGLAGEPFTLRAKVTDLNGDPVLGARVGWEVISSPGGDATVETSPVSTTESGISETTVTLSETEGDNVFHATGHGIADERETGCINPDTGEDWRCNGPRDIFDPFQPNNTALDGGVEVIPDGTRLPFTVFGCIQGRGTPTVDGTLAEGEWTCANSTTFPVNLSGGSTVDATLFWMNDDENFHLAVSVPGTDRENALRFEWDSDGDDVVGLEEGESQTGSRDLADDVWEFEPDAGPTDKFIDEKCADSGQSSCGQNDDEFGGGNQTVATFDNTQGDVTVYEMSHPLTTGDTCTKTGKKGCGTAEGEFIDLEVAASDMAGFFLTLRLGSGAQGNTQWPGFLEYMKVTIK